MAGRMISGAVALAGMVRTATEAGEPDLDRMLPVAAELSGLLPGRGLRRGSTVAVAGGWGASASKTVPANGVIATTRTAAARRGVPARGDISAHGDTPARRDVSAHGDVSARQEAPARAGVAARRDGSARGDDSDRRGVLAGGNGSAWRGVAAGGGVAPGDGSEGAGAGLQAVPDLGAEVGGLRVVIGGGAATGRPAAAGPGDSAGWSVSAGGDTSLMLGLLAAASRNGSWCAVVGVPSLGLLAAAESGVVLERLALVPHPGPDWPTVVAALIDGVDLVVVAVPGPVPASIVSRLAARARQRGSVLVPFGDWTGADVTLNVGHGRWEGLGFGSGRLRRREVTVLARGRGAAARPREITVWMPGVMVRHEPIPPPSPRVAGDHSADPVATSSVRSEDSVPLPPARPEGLVPRPSSRFPGLVSLPPPRPAGLAARRRTEVGGGRAVEGPVGGDRLAGNRPVVSFPVVSGERAAVDRGPGRGRESADTGKTAGRRAVGRGSPLADGAGRRTGPEKEAGPEGVG